MTEPVRVAAEARADLTPPRSRAVWLPLVLLGFGGLVLWAGGSMDASDDWRAPVMIVGIVSALAGVFLALWGGVRGKDPEPTERRLEAKTSTAIVSIMAAGGDAGADMIAMASKVMGALRRDHRMIEPRASGLFRAGEQPLGTGIPLSADEAERLRERDIAAAESVQAELRACIQTSRPKLLDAIERVPPAPSDDAGSVVPATEA